MYVHVNLGNTLCQVLFLLFKMNATKKKKKKRMLTYKFSENKMQLRNQFYFAQDGVFQVYLTQQSLICITMYQNPMECSLKSTVPCISHKVRSKTRIFDIVSRTFGNVVSWRRGLAEKYSHWKGEIK